MGGKFSHNKAVQIPDQEIEINRRYRSFANHQQTSTITGTSIASSNQPTYRQPVPRRLEPQFETNIEKNSKKESCYAKVYFTPESKFIILFDSIRLVIIYLYFIEIPITIAFENHRKEEDSEKIFEEINLPAIALFIVSIFVKIKTAFYHEGVLIADQMLIIKHYLLYNFLFDFLSIVSICMYEFSEILKPRDNMPNPYRYLVIFFYLKLPEVFSIEKSMISAFDLKRRVKAFLKLILLVLKIFLICNIAACGFFYLSDTYCPCSGCCWIEGLQIMNKRIKDSDWYVQYTFSLYWASTTMLTIGYGDITPLNNYQVAFTVASQFISCLVFAFSVNEIWSIILEKNNKKSKIRGRMNIINVYMRDKNVDIDLKSRINAYLSHFYHTKNLREKEMENEIISELTPSLKKQLYYETFGFIFKTHKFFKLYSENFLESVSEYITEVGYFQQEIVFEPNPNNFQTNSLYYVHKGELDLFLVLGNSLVSNVNLMEIEKGMIVGLNDFVRQIDYNSSLIAKKYSLLYVLNYKDWINKLREWDEDFQIFFENKHKVLYEKHTDKLKLECRICGLGGHASEQCLDNEIRKKHQSMIDRYLSKNHRKKRPRTNLRSALDIKSGKFLQQAMEEEKISKVGSSPRKMSINSTSRILATMHQKKLFMGPTHNQKMTTIISRQKLKESIWSDNSESDEFMITEKQLDIDKVRNYDLYCPLLNASADWGKQKRRITLNRLLLGTRVQERNRQQSEI